MGGRWRTEEMEIAWSKKMRGKEMNHSERNSLIKGDRETQLNIRRIQGGYNRMVVGVGGCRGSPGNGKWLKCDAQEVFMNLFYSVSLQSNRSTSSDVDWNQMKRVFTSQQEMETEAQRKSLRVQTCWISCFIKACFPTRDRSGPW